MARKHRKPTLKDLVKRAGKRFDFWVIFIALGLLFDEFIKEGYLFDLHDVMIPFTHEWIIVVLLIVFGVKKIAEKVRKRLF